MLSTMRATKKRAVRPPAASGGTGARGRQKAETRASILAAARRVLKARGIVATTTRAIAEEAGVAVGTVFLHFPDTSVLVETLLDAHLEAALAEAFRTLPSEGLVDRLVHVARRLYDSYELEPELSRVYVAGSLFPAPEHATGTAVARLRAFEAWVAGCVREAVAAGEIAPIDPELAFLCFFSIYFGLLVAGLRGELPRRTQVARLRSALERVFGITVSARRSRGARRARVVERSGS
jgi:AcrR family transcriptional regulator